MREIRQLHGPKSRTANATIEVVSSAINQAIRYRSILYVINTETYLMREMGQPHAPMSRTTSGTTRAIAGGCIDVVLINIAKFSIHSITIE